MLFSTSHLSLAEGKLGSFSEIPELFTKEFTRLIQSFDLTWRDLQISSHCCTPEKEQHKILAARVHADQRHLKPKRAMPYTTWGTMLFLSQIHNEIIRSTLLRVTDGTLWLFNRGYEKAHNGGVPGGPVVQKSTLQCRGYRFNPWSGKIPHATEQRSLCATTTEPTWASTTEAHAP